MALRFIRTREVCPSFPVGRRDEDWLLYSGAWQVGSIGRPGGQENRSIMWSLTGPVTPEAPVEKNGLRPDVTAAKIRLEEAFAPGPRGPVFGRRAASPTMAADDRVCA